jgi:hypothetical protein
MKNKETKNEVPEEKGQFADVLAALKIKIVKYDPSKQRPVSTSAGTMSLQNFAKAIREGLGAQGAKYPGVFEALYDLTELEKMIEQYTEKRGVLISTDKPRVEIPDDMHGLTLNLDLSAKGRDNKFFTTDDNEQVTRISGEVFNLVHMLSPQEAALQARRVIPEYLPRRKPGIFIRKVSDRTETIFNCYIQPRWRGYEHWDKLPAKPPLLVKKLLNHIPKNPDDREFLLDWLYVSVFRRAPTFLVLCGDPGIGKNRLKLLFRALHGSDNTIDGKKSTITEKFNSQFLNATLLWFDELPYDLKMENTMKELHNDTIAIERKGVDSTRGTKIHVSSVISNNKPRDNYIGFEARKFAPLQLTKKRLERSMTTEEINTLTKKLEDPTSATYDVAFIAQTAKWLKARGVTGRWPNLEYRGPMFWYLAHTSMARYQKEIIKFLGDLNGRDVEPCWDHQRQAFVWSKLNALLSRKSKSRDVSFPDFSTVQVFLETFRDRAGKKVYETELLPEPNVLWDFWLKPIDPTGGPSQSVQGKHRPVRPPGMSGFRWKRVQAEWEAFNGKGLKEVVSDIDDL